jgi:hypothetical protein
MNINSNAAEGNSAAQQRGGTWATMCKYFSMDFERILFCDTKGESC